MYHNHYNVQLFDDLHNYLPDILYNPQRFRNVQDVLSYIRTGIDNISPYQRGLSDYRGNITPNTHNTTTTPNITTNTRMRTTPLYTFTIPFDLDVDNLTNNIFGDLLNQRGIRPTNREIQASTTVSTISELLDDTCAICQDEMAIGSQIRKINFCNHTFHKDCIDVWFSRNSYCPTCRHDIREVTTSTTT
jgi:hypothetical protein